MYAAILLKVIVVWMFFYILYAFLRIVCKPLVSAHPGFFFRWGLTSCQKSYANTTNPQWINTDSHPERSYCSDCNEIITIKESSDSHIITNKDLILFNVIMALLFEKIPGGRKATVIVKKTIPYIAFHFLAFGGISAYMIWVAFHMVLPVHFLLKIFLLICLLVEGNYFVLKAVVSNDKAAAAAVINKFIEEYGDAGGVYNNEK